MSTPLRIYCETVTAVPTIAELSELATDGQHVVLVFPQSDENEAVKQLLIEQLLRELPDFSVFNSGGYSHRAILGGEKMRRWLSKVFDMPTLYTEPPPPTTHVTVMKAIPRIAVLINADAIVAAASHFRAVATDLMANLAERLGVPLEAFADPLFRIYYEPGAPAPSGELTEGWTFGFHGYECHFMNQATKQDVDVKLGYFLEFGVLDPYFLAHFIRSTPGHELVASLFMNNYHDPARALSILEQEGRLTRIDGYFKEHRLSGLVAPD